MVKLKIINLGTNGEGVAKNGDWVFFVPYALCGEEVLARVVNIKKNIVLARVVNILSPQNRIEPACAHFLGCGGCIFLNLEYQKQLEFKTRLVENNLKKIGKIDCNVLNTKACKNTLNYRNKISFVLKSVDNKLQTVMCEDEQGGTQHRFSTVVNECLLAGAWASEICKIFLDFANNHLTNSERANLFRLTLRNYSNCFSLCLHTNAKILPKASLLYDMLKAFSENFGLFLCAQASNSKSLNLSHLFGQKTIVATESGVNFELSPSSFFQINDEMRAKLYDYIVDNLENNMHVYDVYCGMGLLSAMLAKKAKCVTGIEINPNAIENANRLLSLNTNINNLNFICDNAEKALPQLLKSQKSTSSAIVLDPPRSGLAKRVIQAIIDFAPNRIIYISCDSATLARDTALLLQSGKFILKSVQPFDMFPQTTHVECVAQFELK